MATCHRYYKNFAIFLVLLLSSVIPLTTLSATASPEYAVKAAYIYNILRFVEWPHDESFVERDDIKICILGNNIFGQYLEPIKNKTIKGKPIRISQKHSLQQTLGCQLVFVSDTEPYPLRDLARTLGDKRIVVVGNNLEFVNNGGMFSFYVENNKVRLALNKDALERSGLEISSLLLEVCTIYGGSQ